MLLADLLRNDAAVRIVGVCRGPEIWGPAKSLPVPIESYPLSHEARYSLSAVKWLKTTLRDDLVIVSKPVPHSLGLALAARVGLQRMVVDIDDWETGFAQRRANEVLSPLAFGLARAQSYGRRLGFNAFTATRALEEVARRAPFRLVSNRWLQARFGGQILYHVRDPGTLDPARAKAPESFSIPADRPWVAFVGTPRRHKGLDVLVDALNRLQGNRAPGLLLMGVDESARGTLERARAQLGERFACVEQFPFEQLPGYLARADVIAIPSLDVPSAWGQIPAKLFDALAMGKPVVVSDVNDMAEIAAGCGLVVPPGDAPALARALGKLSADAELRAQLGNAGRRKFLEQFSYASGRRVLLDVVREAANR
jgi:glycosyltransferase involved in cell wall biosynthesis